MFVSIRLLPRLIRCTRVRVNPGDKVFRAKNARVITRLRQGYGGQAPISSKPFLDYPDTPGNDNYTKPSWRDGFHPAPHGVRGKLPHHTAAKINAEYWYAKVTENRNRDGRTNSILQEAGWEVLRFWEHDDPGAAATRIIDVVRVRRLDSV